VIGMASILGRFFFGWMSDRIGDAKYVSAIGFLLMAAGMLLLMKTTSVATLFAYALLFGFGYGSLSTMMPFLLADRFGRYVLGSAYGVLTFFFGRHRRRRRSPDCRIHLRPDRILHARLVF
jgi:MFS family permease